MTANLTPLKNDDSVLPPKSTPGTGNGRLNASDRAHRVFLNNRLITPEMGDAFMKRIHEIKGEGWHPVPNISFTGRVNQKRWGTAWRNTKTGEERVNVNRPSILVFIHEISHIYNSRIHDVKPDGTPSRYNVVKPHGPEFLNILSYLIRLWDVEETKKSNDLKKGEKKMTIKTEIELNAAQFNIISLFGAKKTFKKGDLVVAGVKALTAAGTEGVTIEMVESLIREAEGNGWVKERKGKMSELFVDITPAGKKALKDRPNVNLKKKKRTVKRTKRLAPAKKAAASAPKKKAAPKKPAKKKAVQKKEEKKGPGRVGKVTRIEAAVLAYKDGARTLDEVTKKGNALYVKGGGKDNEKESKWAATQVLSTVSALNQYGVEL